MKILYFDCFAGISGDMTLGALLDLGIDAKKFEAELEKINVNGYRVEFSRVNKNGIDAFDVDVILEEENHSHKHCCEHDHGHSHGEHHEHSHDKHHKHCHEGNHAHSHEHNSSEHHHKHKKAHSHEHRNLFDINSIIENSEISETAKKLAKNIFMRVAKAEAKVHGKSLEEIHFHEVGALDSIVDIIGAAICIDMIKPDKIYSSVVNDGYGFIMCQHGQIPVPVPATVEIFASSNVIYRQIDVEMELVTPTGAAIIAELAESYGVTPMMKVLKTGYGAGKRSSKIPNALRVVLGEGFDE